MKLKFMIKEICENDLRVIARWSHSEREEHIWGMLLENQGILTAFTIYLFKIYDDKQYYYFFPMENQKKL